MRTLSLLLVIAGCDGGTRSSTDAPAPSTDGTSDATAAAANYVFVTSAVVKPTSVADADAACAAAATDGGLPGAYIAWLSSSTTPGPATRLAGSQGWIRTTGTPIANTVAELLAGEVFHAISRDEHGAAAGGPVLTGTLADGSIGTTCNDWTSTEPSDAATAGIASGTTVAWTKHAATSCAVGGRVYCFGIGKVATIAPAETGRLAFVSTATWVPGGGLASADALCQSEASNAGRTGTFKALLATAAGFGLERFAMTSAWVRADGTALLVPPATSFSTNLNVTIDGTFVADNAWIGHPQLSRCLEWTSNAMAELGTYGAISTGLGAGTPAPCNTAMRIRCLED